FARMQGAVMKKELWLAALLFVLVMLGGAYLWVGKPVQTLPQPVPAAPASAAIAPLESASPASTVSAEPVTLHPIDPPPETKAMGPADIPQALVELMGQKAVTSFFQTDDFARRFVATIDNLGREHAAPILWPINPTQGRFTVEGSEGAAVIAADNSMRYTPFVLLVETVDIGRAVDLYVRAYPMLQQAYQDLGYPKRYFNDRFIEVIDQLLSTPDAAYPVKVTLTEVKGPIPSERPWVRYQFADPEFESLSAGQKVLLRVGPVNERRLKAKLLEIRQQLVSRARAR
ncbi:MAG: DUF3014 domain-containing protein, partial [Burkholderiales bacterium]